jgi:hypothetical protein
VIFFQKKIKDYSNLSVLLLGFFFIISSCKKKGCTDPISLAYDIEARKDDGSCTYPENDRKTLIYYSTGIWCQYCGDIGKTFVDDISSNYPDVQIVSLHKNDELTSNISSLTQSYLDSVNGLLGCPHFYSGLNSVVNPSNNPNNYSQLTSAVEDNLNLFSEVNMDLEYSINGNRMNIKVQSKLSSENPNDNYFLSVYILENGVVKEQNIAGNYNQNFTHNNVLRKEASDNINAFGSSLNFDVNGNDLTSFYDIPLDSTGEWNYSNLYVVAVAWQENDSNYKFVNLAK